MVYFILHRVPHMRPHVTMSRLDPEDPRILRWVYIMARHGGEGHKFVYESAFFHWMRGQLLMVEDYAYEEADFWDEPELALPKGEVWDDHSKKRHLPTMFFFCDLFHFYFIVLIQVKIF